MKQIIPVIVFSTLFLLILTACTAGKGPPDAETVKEQIAENLAQEIDLIRSTVLDDSRANNLVAMIEKRNQLISNHVKKIIAYREEISTLNANYHAERESFNVLMDRYNGERKSSQLDILTLMSDMRKETTPDEWKIISKYQLKKGNPRLTGSRQLSGSA